jgi:hypothetical protein
LPQDDADYTSYVNTIERYETQQLNQQVQDRRLMRTINNNPMDKPVNPAAPPPGAPH